MTDKIPHQQTVSRDDWNAAREKLLAKEKELTHAHDWLAAVRRRMPWEKVEKECAL